MPSWWGKSSSKEVKKKANRESFIDSIHRKFNSASEEKCNSRSGGSRRRCSDTVSERGTRSRVPSRSPSPSTQVSRCQSFAERPHAQPLPLPGVHLPRIGRTNSGISASAKPGFDRGSKPHFFPLPRPGCVLNRADPANAEADIAAASFSSDSSVDSDDPSDSRFLSPLASDYENGNRTTMNSPSSGMHEDQSPVVNLKNSKEILKPVNPFNNPHLSSSPKRRPLYMQNIPIPPHGAFCSAPDSSMSSPSRSPMRVFMPEQVINSSFWAGKSYPDVASGHCSSPGSGHNSGHNSVGGAMSGQLLWTHSRCSPECSQVSWGRRFWLFIGLVSFLCALSIFTESQFYAYTIGIHGTYAHIIYYFVGVTLSAAILVLLINPGCCTAFLENYKGCFIIKSCGGYLVMFTICFLSSGTGLQYLGLSSNGTAPNPAVAVAVAPYRSQAFSEIAGLLASALLTVNALSIIILLRPAKYNTIFEVAATLTLESAMALLYKCPCVTVAAAVFIMAMTLLKNFLCRDHQK